MRRRTSGAAVLAAALLLPGCVEPPLAESPANAERGGVIHGTVTVQAGPARGDVYVLLLPQPGSPGVCPTVGTSLAAPEDVVRVPADTLFPDLGGGTRSAAFILPLVPAGCWSLAALLDEDADFSPLFSVTAGATRGDVIGGAFLEPLPDPPASPALRVISVAPDAGGFFPATRGVQVVVGSTVPFERPSFRVEVAGGGDPSAVPTMSASVAEPVRITLSAAPLEGAWVSTGAPFFPVVPGPPAEPGGTVPADRDGDGLPDVGGVRVLLRRLSSAPGARPWTLDEAFPLVVPAAVDPSRLLRTTPDESLGFYAASSLDVVVLPVAFLAGGSDPPAPQPLATWEGTDLSGAAVTPAGRYSVMVRIEATGQTWSLPNELLLLDGSRSQGGFFEIVP